MSVIVWLRHRLEQKSIELYLIIKHINLFMYMLRWDWIQLGTTNSRVCIPFQHHSHLQPLWIQYFATLSKRQRFLHTFEFVWLRLFSQALSLPQPQPRYKQIDFMVSIIRNKMIYVLVRNTNTKLNDKFGIIFIWWRIIIHKFIYIPSNHLHIIWEHQQQQHKSLSYVEEETDILFTLWINFK